MGPAALASAKALCDNVLEPVRARVGGAVTVSSGYRSPEVNRRVGGAATSQHTKGEAADINTSRLSTRELFDLIRKDGNIEFDQLIEEFPGSRPGDGWVHVSYRRGRNRNQCLRARRVNGRTVYTEVAR